MFKLLFGLSILFSAISLITMITGSGSFELLLACIVSTITLGCLQSFQSSVIESFKAHNSIIAGLQQQCKKLEDEIARIKNKKQ